MLKAMFEEIQSRLGRDYGLFQEFNPQVFRSEEYLARYKNVGVLYINNGNLGKLPNAAKMDISYTLELFMRIEESYVTSDMVTKDLEDLATGTTGHIYPDGVDTQFVLDTGLPTSDGAVVEGLGEYNYIRYEVPIQVTFTQGVALSDTGKVSVTIGDVTETLQSVISVVEVPQTQLDTVSFVSKYTDDSGTTPYEYKAMENESYVMAHNWSIEITKLFRPNSIDEQLRDLILDSPQEMFTITYQSGDFDTAHTYRVIAHNCTFSNELGQPILMTLRCSSAMRGI